MGAPVALDPADFPTCPLAINRISLHENEKDAGARANTLKTHKNGGASKKAKR